MHIANSLIMIDINQTTVKKKLILNQTYRILHTIILPGKVFDRFGFLTNGRQKIKMLAIVVCFSYLYSYYIFL